MPKKNLEVLATYVRPEVKAQIEQWAKDEGRPVSNLLSRIIEQALLEREKEQSSETE